MTDLDIAKEVELRPIQEIAQQVNITEEDLELYGKYKAKLLRPNHSIALSKEISYLQKN